MCMLKWKRVKAGEHVSKDGRFRATRHEVWLHKEWHLHDNRWGHTYVEDTIWDFKDKAESIIKEELEKKYELKVKCCLHFKTNDNNIDDLMKEIYKVLNKARIDIGESPHCVLYSGSKIIDEK